MPARSVSKFRCEFFMKFIEYCLEVQGKNKDTRKCQWEWLTQPFCEWTINLIIANLYNYNTQMESRSTKRLPDCRDLKHKHEIYNLCKTICTHFVLFFFKYTKWIKAYGFSFIVHPRQKRFLSSISNSHISKSIYFRPNSK